MPKTKKYDFIDDPASDGLRDIRLDEKYGLLAPDGSERVPCEYDWIFAPASDGLRRVHLGDLWGLLAPDGTEVVPCRYDWISTLASDGLRLICLGGLYGLLAPDGTERVPCEFREIFCPDSDGYRLALKNGDKYSITPDGTITKIEIKNKNIPKKYLILEEGFYEDYKVSVVDMTNCKLTEEEVLILLNTKTFDDSIETLISGRINGELTLFGSVDLIDLKTKAKAKINNLFNCCDSSEIKTVLDKFYSKEECLEIGMTNDSFSKNYWADNIDYLYAEYAKAYPIYKKLIN